MKRFEAIFSDVLRSVREEFRSRGTFFLEDAYILGMQEELGLFPRILDAVRGEANAVRADEKNAEYALFVCRAMEKRDVFLGNLELFTFPDEYPLLPLLCLLPTVRYTRDAMAERGVPEDVIRATLGQYEACVFIHQKRFDCLGLHKRYFDWLQHYVDCEILNIERLRFEIMTLHDPVWLLERKTDGHKVLLMGGADIDDNGLRAGTPPVTGAGFAAEFRETDAYYEGNPVSPEGRCLWETVRYPKGEYRILLAPGDTCLSVHIPDEGDFSRERCEESYAKAREIFAAHYPELDIRGFHCHSWMLAPELGEILGERSRIVAFGERYFRYPVPTEGKDVLNFVFYQKFHTYEDLPEDTSLQRALKKRYLAGGYLYEYGGVFV